MLLWVGQAPSFQARLSAARSREARTVSVRMFARTAHFQCIPARSVRKPPWTGSGSDPILTASAFEMRCSMKRCARVVLLLVCSGPLLAAEPSPERRAGFAYARALLVQKGVPFDPDLLLRQDWRSRLAGVFDSMPELRAERQELSGRLKGAYLAGTLVLPEKVVATGDVVILARRIVFLGRDAMIVGPGKNVGLFPIDAILAGVNTETATTNRQRRVSVFTGSLLPDLTKNPREEEQLRVAAELLCASDEMLDGCDPYRDGYDGYPGNPGNPGADGAPGTPVSNGAHGSCTGNRDGDAGPGGEWGRDADNGQQGGGGGHGTVGGVINCDIPWTDGGTYNL
jgi:hypothetical protein